MRKCNIVTIIIILIVSVFLSSQIIAYAAPDKARTIIVHLTQLSDEAYYVDILVKITDADTVYTKFNSENAKQNAFVESDSYVAYENDGYISYSLHFVDARSDMKINKYKSDYSEDIRSDNQFVPFNYPYYDKNFDLLMQYSPKIKVAILNEKKEVIHVSDVGIIKKAKGYLTGGITYNISDNRLHIDYYTPSNKLIILIIIFICATVIILISFFIKSIRKYKKKTSKFQKGQ